MRNLLLLSLSVLLLSSCSTYEYLTLNSANMIKNDRNELTWENDTLKLVYNFHGMDAPMNITIYNKTDQPLYINWKKSALIHGEQAVSFFNPTVQVSGNIETSSYSTGRQTGYSSSSLKASFDIPEGTEFIAPKTLLSKMLVNAQQNSVIGMEAGQNLEERKAKGPDGLVFKFKQVKFEEATSPVQFKSYLTFALGNNAGKEFSLQHTFYATEILQSKEDPYQFSLYGQGGDMFYTKETLQ